MIRSGLAKFEKYEFVAIKGAKEGTKVTVCKWATYQDIGQGKGQGKGQDGGKRGATNNNEKNEEELKKERYRVCFDEFWNLYPKKKGKRPGKDISKERMWTKIKEVD